MKLSHISLAVLSAIALAACGGSGSSSQVIPGDGGKDKEKEKEATPVVTADLKLKSDFSTDFGAAAGKDIRIKGKDTKVVEYDVSAIENQGYVANSKLLDENGQLTGAGAANAVVADVFTKDKDGNFVTVHQVGAAGKTAVYAKDDADKTPLKADQLYQRAPSSIPAAGNNNANTVGSYLTGIEAFGNTASITDIKSLPKAFSLDKLKAGMSEGDINYAYTSQVEQKGSDLTAITNADGGKNYLTASGKVKQGSYKAYKQNLTAVALVADANGDLSDLSFTGTTGLNNAGTQTGALIAADKTTLSLPENVKAMYEGKAFTQKSEGGLSLNVEFGKASKARFEGKITRKDLTTGDTLKDYLIESQDVTVGNAASFDLNVVDSKTKAAAGEYEKMKGNFFGENAEEMAGTLVDNSDEAAGVFAASKK